MENSNILKQFFINCFEKRRFRRNLNIMATHIHNSPIELTIKLQKLDRVNSLIDNLDCLCEFPLVTQTLGLIIIDVLWKSLVKDCGFVSVYETLKHLNLGLDYSCINLNEKYNTCYTGHDILNTFIPLIKPINCQLRLISNLEPRIECVAVRPALPSLQGRLNGLCVNIEQPNFTLKVFGTIDNDPLRYFRNQINKEDIIEEIQERYALSVEDVQPYLNAFSLRNYVVYEARQLAVKIKQEREKIEFYKSAEQNVIYAEFQFMADNEKIELINLLLEIDELSHAKYLLKKSNLELKYFDYVCQQKICSSYKNLINPKDEADEDEAPYEIKIAGMNASDKVKSKAYDKLKMMLKSHDGGPKEQKYLDGLLKIPFGQVKSEISMMDDSKKMLNELVAKYPEFKDSYEENGAKVLDEIIEKDDTGVQMASNIKKTIESTREKQQDYLQKVQEILDTCVHGHKLVKTQIHRLLAKWISGGQSGVVIGIQGPPGNGKTTLIKQGLAKCLVDQQGKPRPVGFVPLGGSSSASSLVGHNYTYVGSNWGRIVDILMDCNCMNPIFLFDELDKVSHSEHGKEIIGILTHLTDSSQNEEFYDKYFDGIPLDLSKALMVFTFNDRSLIDPILLDRMTVIKTDALNIDDKKVIALKHLIPQIVKGIDLRPDEIEITEEIIENLVLDYTREPGARQLKRLLDDLIQELNLRRLLDPTTQMKINDDLVNDVLQHLDKIRPESISSSSELVGQINGMYANALGMGGILPIQVSELRSESRLELTGTQGDVMKESMKCAKTMALGMILDKEADDEAKEKLSKIGLHIHCPDTSMPKDGPSAGGAICLAIYSFLTKKPIKQTVAMTGEIDLIGNITAIGGLGPKLNGAKKAGVTLALIPKENEPQLQRLRDEKETPEGDDFKVIMVDHISQGLEHVFEHTPEPEVEAVDV
jgi:ATP-dependent Lon protease